MKFYTNVALLGNQILLREVENGIRSQYRVDYQPTLYVPSPVKSNWHTLSGEDVKPIQFGSIKETRDFVRENSGIPNFEINGMTMYQYAFIADEYPEKELAYNTEDIVIVTTDIETECENGFPDVDTVSERINVITIKDFRKDEYHVFTFQDGKIYTKENYYVSKGKNVKHYSSNSEEEMLLEFLNVWKKINPDILTGWNVRVFDVPYIYNRLVKLLGKKVAARISPWGVVHPEKVTILGRDYNSFNIIGLSILDYYQLYRKLVLDPRDNYKLGYIAQFELGETKTDWQSKYETMKDFYTKDFQMFVEYNIQDVHLPDQLEAKLKLIEQVVNISYIAKSNYIDVLAQTRVWDVIIYNWLLDEKIVVPFKEIQEKNEQFLGAAVKIPVAGIYENVVSFDVASLYPSIIRALNIGPETKSKLHADVKMSDMLEETERFSDALKEAKENNHSLAANGIMYDRAEQSFFSKMIEKFTGLRKTYQLGMREAVKERETCTDPVKRDELSNIESKFNVKQKAVKVMSNSLYGAFGSAFFRFYDLENAVAVTSTGQVIIKKIQMGVNDFLNNIFKTKNEDFIIYSDTDSCAGDTLIDVNGQDVTIEEFWNSSEGTIVENSNNQMVKLLEPKYTTKCSDGISIEKEPINYVMCHEVEKEMYEIEVAGNKVIVTEDHSVMIMRDDKLISVKPREILDTDILLYKLEQLIKTNIFKITPLGKKKIKVYDIEVKNKHNFFGNNILIHNSIYVTLDKLVKHVSKDKTWDVPQRIKFLDKVCKEKLEPLIDSLFEKINVDILNGMVSKKSILSMKREIIADRGIWTEAKKHYILQIWNSEGENFFKCVDCGNKFSGPSDIPPPCNSCKSEHTKRVPKLKILGFEMVKSTTPVFCRNSMKEAVDIILNKDQSALAEYVESVRVKFMAMPVEDIAKNSGVNNLGKYSDETESEEIYKKGTPYHVKAVLAYNNLIKQKKLQQKYPFISDAEKLKILFLKSPNPINEDAIAFIGSLPKEFGLHKYIDYREMYEKVFLNPIKKVTDPIGWDTEKRYDMDKFFK